MTPIALSLFDLAAPVPAAPETHLSASVSGGPSGFAPFSCSTCGATWRAFPDSTTATRCHRCAVAGRPLPKYEGK